MPEGPLTGRVLFVVGAPRSGTNWLQRMLAGHPSVSAVPGETHLFSAGINVLLERFQYGVLASAETGRVYAERDTVLPLVRALCDAVLLPHLEAGATLLLERTPHHVSSLDAIFTVYPDARVVHIIRDGRDVTRSLSEHNFGPDSVTTAAREWHDAITSARAAAIPDRYREVRYEDLFSDPAERLRELFDWLGLATGDEALRAPLDAAGTHRNPSPDRSPPGVGKWQTSWTAQDLEDFEAAAGSLREELGYPAAAIEPGRGGEQPRPRRPRTPPPWRRRNLILDDFIAALVHDPPAARAYLTADAAVPDQLETVLRDAGVQVGGSCRALDDGFLVELVHRRPDTALRSTTLNVQFEGAERIRAVTVEASR
jgi:hypothetical protein